MSKKRLFKSIFHLGLMAPIIILLLQHQGAMKHLLWVGIPHMVLLYIVGRSLPIAEISLSVQTLHKAGFLHTLIGLGGAVMAVAQEWGKAGHASLILAPIGAALVPHILGVWFGHEIEMNNSKSDIDGALEEMRKKAEENVRATLELLNHVQTRVKNLTTSLDSTIKESVTEIQSTLKTTVGKIQSASGTATGEIKSASGTATGKIQSASGTATGEIKSASGTATGEIKSALSTAVMTVSTIKPELDKLFGAIKVTNDSAQATNEVVNKVLAVANQLVVTEQQIALLLKSSLIRETRR